MAKLTQSEKEELSLEIYRLLRRSPYGLSEYALTKTLGADGRSVMACLRRLARNSLAQPQGRVWYSIPRGMLKEVRRVEG